MSNVPLMFQPLVKYADFQGRSRRSEFWLWVLFQILLGMAIGISVACFLVPSLAMLPDPSAMAQNHPFVFMRLMPFFGLIGLINLALLIPTIAVAVRRLHDTGRSGWWVVLPYVAAMVGAILFMIIFGASLIDFIARNEKTPLENNDYFEFVAKSVITAIFAIWLPTFIASIILIVFYLSDGKAGANRFGPDPKGRGEPAPSSLMSLADVPEEMH